MLKCSNLIKNQLKYTLARRLFHYQNDIYINKEPILLTSNNNLNELKNEIEKSNENIIKEPNLYRYIKAYRQYGFKISKINPIETENCESVPLELDPKTYGLVDKSSKYSTNGLLFKTDLNESNSNNSLTEIEEYLRNTYSKNVTIEFEHIRNEEEKYWLAKRFEQMQQQSLESNVRVNILKLMAKSQVICDDDLIQL